MSDLPPGIIIRKEIDPSEHVKFKLKFNGEIKGEANLKGDKILFTCPHCKVSFWLNPEVFKSWFECVYCNKKMQLINGGKNIMVVTEDGEA